MKRLDNFLEKWQKWQIANISHSNYVLLISLVVGIISGLSAVVLKNTVFYTHKFLITGANVEGNNFLLLAYPFIGMLISVIIVKFLMKVDISHGISKVLFSISRNSSYLAPHNTYSSMISSTITVGFGGSVGLEAPIVLTGASIGSNLARILRMDRRVMTLMIGCGAAGAISGIFKAPITGIVFALEVLMLDLTMTSLIPLLIASVSAATISSFFMGKTVLFNFTVTDPFNLSNIPFYIVLGIICGFVALYFTRMELFIEKRMKKITNPWKKLIIGGFAVSLLIFIFPSLYGEGYETLKYLLSGKGAQIAEYTFFYSMKDNFWFFTLFVILILFFKVIATAFTLTGGGIGGVFAPSLFMGGVTGFITAYVINYFGFVKLPTSNFALAGMAGIMASVMHAPLTSIFLIAEITGGYEFFIPLIITSTISYLTINLYEPHSIYTTNLAEKGDLITHNKDKTALTLMSIDNLIEKNFLTISPDASLGELVKLIAKSERNIFPVVDKDNTLNGIIFINDIRRIIFERELYDTTYVRNLMFMPDTIIEVTATMEQVAQKFNESLNYNIPVLKDGKYIGFVSRANVFSAYRNYIKDFSQE